ncbi:MAG: dihydroxyacetone kinase subunit DhaK [Candidatus Limivicinus sp.]|nr:dihydroxyacetone kinase subunit DhaK [Candidatus Limivicinus sp.]
MKKIINDPERVVSEMLAGIEISDSSLKYIPGFEVIARREPNKEKVAIISGGGSGHEPAHAGYVGRGMLDAAVAGNVFASPSPDRILEAIHQVGGDKGILMVIKNYSGDIMNFSMAAELAEMEGYKVMSVVTRDDVAVPESTYSTGRRGIAGTVFVHKIAGAAAEAGRSLEEVRDVAQKVIDNTRSMGMAMSPCILPGVGKPGFVLADDEIEVGMGIHGEPGVERTSVKTSKELAEILCGHILADMDFSGSDCAVMVNGLGGTPLMELYILTNDVNALLREKGINPVRWYVGNYMTSLEMSGCSVSLLRLDDEMKAYLDAPAHTAAWRE